MQVHRSALGRAARRYNVAIGVIGVGALALLTALFPPSPSEPLLALTFFGLFVFARLMRFEIPPNITASLVVPLQIAGILLLGPLVTAWIALPAFLVEVVSERPFQGLSPERRSAVAGIIWFNLGMEALVTLAGGFTWQQLAPEGGLEKEPGLGLLAVLGTFVAFKAVNESLMVAGNWLRGTQVQRYVAGARTTVLIETLTLPIAALLVMVQQRLPDAGFYLFVASVLIAATLVRGLTRARAGLAAANVDLERKVREIEALARIGQAISADIELDRLLETIFQRCRDILVANHFFIALYTEGASTLSIALEVVNGQRQPPTDIALGQGLTSHVILSRSPLLVRDMEAERADLPAQPIFTDESPSRSWLGVPMVAKGEVVGAIVLQEVEPRAYDEDDLRVLSAIAAQAAISVKNARLHREALRALRVEEENRQLLVLNAKKSEFVDMVAHQFRTPLTAVIGYADLLVKRLERGQGEPSPELGRHLRTVQGESRRLADMVEELLNLSRIRSGRLPLTIQRFDLARLAREVIASHQLLAEQRRIAVQLNAEGGVEVPGDSNYIRQAVANILANALKYAPEDSAVAVNVTRRGEDAIIEVVDQGPGVPESDLERVFDEFYRAPGATAERPGTGLGLSICRGIVGAHGGRAWAERRGAGTAFLIALPLCGSREASEWHSPG